MIVSQEALLNPDLQIDRGDLVYDEDKDFLGGGGYGEVYKATLKLKGSERPVAVKVFLDFKRRKSEKSVPMHLQNCYLQFSIC